MFNLKSITLAATLMLGAGSAWAGPASTTVFGRDNGTVDQGTEFAWATTTTGGNFNVIDPTVFFQLSLGNTSLTVDATASINGGNGVATSGFNASLGTQGGFTTSAPLTITYVAAQAFTFGNTSFSPGADLLTFTASAGANVSISDGTILLNFNAFATPATQGLFTSDIFQFRTVNAERTTYSFSTVNAADGSNVANGFEVAGNGNFSSNPAPTVPEAPSAALLLAGLATVGFVARRRAA